LELLSKWLKNPQLSLNITQKNIQRATVYGEVKSPHQYELHRRVSLAELLAYSGGPTEEAAGTLQIFRTQAPACSDVNGSTDADLFDPTGKPSRTFTLSEVLSGKEESNPIIYPGDVVLVDKARPVYVVGEVLAPQGIYLKEGGMTLYEAISKVGGVGREAKTKDIKIHRNKGDSKDREVITANLDRINKGLEKDIMLQPNDVIEVGRAKDSIAMTIAKFAIGAGRQLVTSGASGLGYKVIY